jgi:drug/metabolite transporter (DMT)-like permease
MKVRNAITGVTFLGLSMRDNKTALGIVLALVSAAGFATLGVFAKFLYSSGFSPLAALSWRFIVAALVLWSFLFFSGRWNMGWPKFRTAFILGVLGFSTQAGLFFATVSFLDVTLAALLLYLYPALVVVFESLIVRRFPPRVQSAAVCLSLFGACLTLQPSGHGFSYVGVAFGISCALWYSVYLIVSARVLREIDSIFATASLSLGAICVFVPLAIFRGEFVFPKNQVEWALIVGVACVATVVPIVALFASMQRIGAALASLVSSFEIVATVIFGGIILHETLIGIQWFGAILIGSAVVLIYVGATKRALRLPR